MKKLFAIFLSCLFLCTACIGGGLMELTYKATGGAQLRQQTVYLEVRDKRPSQDLVGQTARSQELFKELYGGRFDLVTEMPNGSKITLTGVDAPTAVYEAASRRLSLMGVNVIREPQVGRTNVIINIDQMYIDVINGELVADIKLSNEIFRDPSEVFGHRGGTESRRMKLIGGTGGSAVLSDALTTSMNTLNFSNIDH